MKTVQDGADQEDIPLLHGMYRRIASSCATEAQHLVPRGFDGDRTDFPDLLRSRILVVWRRLMDGIGSALTPSHWRYSVSLVVLPCLLATPRTGQCWAVSLGKARLLARPNTMNDVCDLIGRVLPTSPIKTNGRSRLLCWGNSAQEWVNCSNWWFLAPSNDPRSSAPTHWLRCEERLCRRALFLA